jgi:hypothetical protein
MRFVSMLIGACLAGTAALAGAESTPAAKPVAAAPAKIAYSTNTTTMSDLLADPVAKAVLERHIPDLVHNPDLAERAGGLTLRQVADAIKSFSPDALPDTVLGDIDADFATLAAKR